jgi:tetratricopeptide (TPR) repeat protein
VGRSLTLVANFLTQRGRAVEARPYYERALSIAERSSGPAAPEMRSIYNGLGTIYKQRGQWTEAAAHYRRSIDLADEYLGPSSSFAGAVLTNLSGALRRLGRYVEAREACERAVDILIEKRAVGPEHPIVAIAWGCLGFVSFDERRYEEAASRFRRAVAIAERASPDMPDHALALVHLGETYLITGRARDALPLLARAVAVMETHEVELDDRADARFALARALWEAGTDRKLALAVAASASDDYRAAGEGRKDDWDRVSAWLARRNARTAR